MKNTPKSKKSAAPARRSSWFSRLLPFLVVAAGLFGLVADTRMNERGLDLFQAYYRAPEALGFPFQPNTEPIPRLMFDDDGYVWLRHAKDALAQGRWMMPHWTSMDNHPAGREVWWSSPYLWWLLLVAKGCSVLAGGSAADALPRAAVWANPVLHLIGMAAFFLVLRRRTGALPAALFALAFGVMPRFLAGDFQSSRPDHQSLLVLCDIGACLCLLLGGQGRVRRGDAADAGAGLLAAPGRRAARGWMAAMGVLNGCSLWISASPQIPLIGAIGVVGLALAWFRGLRDEEEDEAVEFDPAVWRWWGWGMGLTSLLGYLVERLPDHLFPVPVEVNNPLHVIAALAGAELIVQLGRARREGGFRPRRIAGLAASAILLAAPLLVALVIPVQYVPTAKQNPDIAQMSTTIEEFKSPLLSNANPVTTLLAAFAGLPAMVAVAWLGYFERRVPRRHRAPLLAVTVPALVALGLYLWMDRHSSLYASVLLPAALGAGLVRLDAPRQDKHRGDWMNTLMMLVALGTIGWFAVQRTAVLRGFLSGQVNSPVLLEMAVYREAARHVRLAHPDAKLVFMNAAVHGAKFQYFADASVTASQYENAAGVSASYDFFSDTGDLTRARRLAVERGITHVVVNRSPAFLRHTVRGDPPEYRLPAEPTTLAQQLCLPEPKIPAWLEIERAQPPLFAEYPVDVSIYRVVATPFAAP